MEIGAGWIHGINGNAVYNLAEAHGLLKPVDYKEPTDPRLVESVRQFRDTQANIIPRDTWKPVLQTYNDVFAEAESFYQKV